MSQYNHSFPDEGYSEDPLTVRSPSYAPLPPWLLRMSVTDRTGYVMNIIAQLPTSQVADIVSRLRPRLYINFFQHLPNEVLLHILGFLDPVSLLNTARASREWMLLALDSRLWEQLYLLEGFQAIRSMVQRFEEIISVDHIETSGENDEGHRSKRRASSLRNFPITGDGDSKVSETYEPNSRQSYFHEDVTQKNSAHIDTVPDVQMLSSSNSAATFGRKAILNQQQNQVHSQKSVSSACAAPQFSMSSLFILDRRGDTIKKKLNWHYLYSQRRKLESNWEAKKYVNFQLPDPSHPEEAHHECIYTIQHSGKYLVSGSRDKTVRIWNLDTRRLVRPPLRAHTGSVLCLQFDADPREDLIVSGSSDSTVVLWKFSTGQVIQRLRNAHKESVLNVQFDKRVLVTCSKDKTIKIFNRRPLHAGEPGYYFGMQAINPVPTFLNNYGFNPAPTAGLPIKPAYSLIGVLEGHGAAVNAVQIRADEVVSASGDRLVKVWNWPEQTCVRTLIGHSKGIACVQYDGRRIVSGSSDNEVKVFDKETGLEVASLRAHTNLVRTIQAGFGDLPYSSEDDVAEAKAVDYEYFKALEAGAISCKSHTERGRLRNAGSRRPEHITAYGAKLPPGGGGGRFGRIVSGSYDETIIIWRKDKDGVWKAQHILRQEDAARVAARSRRHRSRSRPDVGTPAYIETRSPHQQISEIGISPLQDVNDSTVAPIPLESNTRYNQLIDGPFTQSLLTPRSNLAPETQLLNNQNTLENQININPHDAQPATAMVSTAEPSVSQDTAQPLLQALPDTSVNLFSSGNSSVTPGELTSIPNDNFLPTSAINHSQTANSPVLQNPPHHNITSNMARVFKLQFDARRIICCSQTNIIVGWDFANNNRKIMEASRFFAPIE